MKTYKILKITQNHMGNQVILVVELAETDNIAGNLIFGSVGDQFIFSWDSLEAQNILHIAKNGDGYVDYDISSFKHRTEIDDGRISNRYFHNSVSQ